MENNTSSPIRKIIKDAHYYSLAKIIPGVLAFLAVIFYTRLLSPGEYGLYILAITTISIVNSICFEWLNKSILRYFEEYKQNQRLPEFISTIVNSLTGIILLVLIFWYFGIYLLQSYLDPNLAVLLKIGGAVILAQAGYTFILFVRQVAQESFKYTIRAIVNAVAKLGIAVCLIYFCHLGPGGIFWGIIISSGSIFLWDIFSFYRKWQIKISHFSKKLFKDFLSYGFPLVGFSVASLILVVADRYMIEHFLTTSEVGIYSAGYNLANEIIQFPIAILLLAAYPIIVETFEKKGKSETSMLLNKILSIYFIFLMPMVFAVAALSENIVVLLGKDFQEVYMIFPWVLAGAFCFGLTQYFYKPFELKKRTKDLLYLIIFPAILNIILNLFFIPCWGIIGAAYATFISYFIYLLSAWLISSKIFLWSLPWQTIIKVIFASAIMYLIILFFLERKICLAMP